MGHPNITVNCRILDNDYDANQREQAVEIINNILDEMDNGHYTEGCRNDIAVDLTCACYVLGMDSIGLVDDMDLLDHYSFLDFKDRAKTIKRYLSGWDTFGYAGVFDYMVNEYCWKGTPQRKWVMLVNNERSDVAC